MSEGDKVWRGYWGGASSISSVTSYTQDRNRMEEWALDGAEITEFVLSSSLSTSQARLSEAVKVLERIVRLLEDEDPILDSDIELFHEAKEFLDMVGK